MAVLVLTPVVDEVAHVAQAGDLSTRPVLSLEDIAHCIDRDFELAGNTLLRLALSASTQFGALSSTLSCRQT